MNYYETNKHLTKIREPHLHFSALIKSKSKQYSEFDLNVAKFRTWNYKGELHFTERGYKKLANCISKVLKDINDEYYGYPSITCETPAIKPSHIFLHYQ